MHSIVFQFIFNDIFKPTRAKIRSLISLAYSLNRSTSFSLVFLTHKWSTRPRWHDYKSTPKALILVSNNWCQNVVVVIFLKRFSSPLWYHITFKFDYLTKHKSYLWYPMTCWFQTLINRMMLCGKHHLHLQSLQQGEIQRYKIIPIDKSFCKILLLTSAFKGLRRTYSAASGASSQSSYNQSDLKILYLSIAQFYFY